MFNKSMTNENRIYFTRIRTKYNKIRRNAKIQYKLNEGKKLENIAKKINQNSFGSQ